MTTIKIDAAKSIAVEPDQGGKGIRVELVLFGATMASAVLSVNQCIDLHFALSKAVDELRGQAGS